MYSALQCVDVDNKAETIDTNRKSFEFKHNRTTSSMKQTAFKRTDFRKINV